MYPVLEPVGKESNPLLSSVLRLGSLWFRLIPGERTGITFPATGCSTSMMVFQPK